MTRDEHNIRKLSRYERILKRLFNKFDRYLQRLSERKWERHERKFGDRD